MDRITFCAATVARPRRSSRSPNGDQALYFSRLPAGRAMYVVTVGSDGLVKSIEQRLTDQNIRKIGAGVWTQKEGARLARSAD